MRKSARMLGEEYGLTSQEMNYILKEEGYLSGEAGEYTVTDKGAPFAEEKDFHRGTGGYAHYNRYWTTRTWDESIEDELNVTADMKEAARNAVAEARRQHWDNIKKARAEADAAFLERYKQNDENDNASDESSDDDSNLLGAGLIIGGLIVLGYGVYKAVPHIVEWWKGSAAPKLTSKKAVKEMICPSCGDTMKSDDKTAVWKCDKCNYSISEKALSNGEVFWFCDKCEAFMNTQKGFNTKSSHWTCSKCGFDNDVTAANIDE
jgi:ribosomal protein L37AE/L43A